METKYILQFLSIALILQDSNASPLYSVLRRFGLNKQYRICDSTMFQVFFNAVCDQHMPAIKSTQTSKTTESNFVEKNQAQLFLKSRPSGLSKSNDQNFMSECCSYPKYGCTVREIYDYCSYVPVARMPSRSQPK